MPALEHALARLDEAELAVEVVRVARVQEPLRLRERAFVDREAHELDAEAPTAMLVEDVDVGEIRLAVSVREGPREPDLLAVVVQADDPRRAVDSASCTSRGRPLAQYDCVRYRWAASRSIRAGSSSSS